MKTYEQEFPIGCRVRIHAGMRRDGSDYELHGREGSLVSHGMWAGVKLDRPKNGWPNPVYICPNHLRPAQST